MLIRHAGTPGALGTPGIPPLRNELTVREGRLKVVEGRLKVGSRPGETEASAATDLG